MPRGKVQSEQDLYTPVARIEMVRLVIAVAVSLGSDIHQIDLKWPLNHAPLPNGESIFTKLRTVPRLDSVAVKLIRLVKSLYVLR